MRNTTQTIKAARPRRPHPNFSEYACEAVGTAFNVFVGLSAAVFDFGKGLPMEHWIASASVRRAITALIFAGSGSLFAISPLGKLSGAHINPSMSLAFFARGKMFVNDLVGYIVGQFLGALVASVLLLVVWGPYFASVDYGMTLPGNGYPLWFVFLAEVLMTGTLILAVFTFLSSRQLMRWTPLMTWVLVAALVWVGAPVSGTSLNPARSVGPAVVAWVWRGQWIYVLAPPLGALGATALFSFIAVERRVLTAKLFHVPHYPCIFKNVHVPHLRRLPDGRLQPIARHPLPARASDRLKNCRSL
ncbi:MAG: aquaporin family protein [Verrucomicrobia bacterium]|nr:aquaporin family protein [Verrucomicrobiota bacterium]